MIQAEYRRELSHSYMIIKNTQPSLTEQYAYRMIRQNRIRGLLSCQERLVNGESCLYFDISSRQQLDRLYEGQRMSAEKMGQILREIAQTQENMGEYLLDGEALLLEPAYIFADVETEELSFCFFTEERDGQSRYQALADFFLEHVDHGQEAAVNLAYQFYKLSKSEYFVLTSFLPYMEKECSRERETAVRQSEPMQTMGSNAGTGAEWPSDTEWSSCKEEAETAALEEAEEQSIVSDRKEETGSKKKKNLFGRLFRWSSVRERTAKEEGGKKTASLWDVYADRLEQKEAGETIYFSDLEKTVPKKTGRPFLVEVSGKRRFALENLPVTVGKLPQKAGIVLEDASVSRIHARFFSEEQDIWLMDLNSKNGTIVNEKRLLPNEAVKVEDGDEILFGRERFQLSFIDSKEEW